MERRFAGKVALVTGAGSGIGQATALAFARDGASVAAVDIAPAAGEETVRMIRSAGGEAIFIRADVTNETDVKNMVARTVEQYGRLDCALNNAGASDKPTAPTAECEKESWDRTIALDLTSVFLCMKYELQQMLKQGGGAIANTASEMGLIAHPIIPGYVAAKHGVVGLTKSTALAYIKNGIRVNAVLPGHTDTPIYDPIRKANPQAIRFLEEETPIGRLAKPEEIASAVLWLCSDEASYCSGHALVIDGCNTIK